MSSGRNRSPTAHQIEVRHPRAGNASCGDGFIRFGSPNWWVYFLWSLPYPTLAKFVRGLKSDDSVSMEFVESGKRKEALIDVLHFLVRLYGAVSGDLRGIRAIRFLNGGHHLLSDNLKRKDDIEKVIKAHKFQGLARIGAGLMREILKPFVFANDPSWVKGTPKKLRQLERPLLVMVITSGVVNPPPLQYRLWGQDSNLCGWKVEGEPKDWVEKAVASVKRALSTSHVGKKGMDLCPEAVENLTVLMATWTNRDCIPICTGW